jgi:hypothetical protein
MYEKLIDYLLVDMDTTKKNLSNDELKHCDENYKR